MKKDLLEDKLRESLGNYSSEMHLSEEWEQLSKLRSKPKKKRRVLPLWWCVVGMGLISILMAVYIIDSSEKSIIDSNSDVNPIEVDLDGNKNSYVNSEKIYANNSLEENQISIIDNDGNIDQVEIVDNSISIVPTIQNNKKKSKEELDNLSVQNEIEKQEFVGNSSDRKVRTEKYVVDEKENRKSEIASTPKKNARRLAAFQLLARDKEYVLTQYRKLPVIDGGSIASLIKPHKGRRGVVGFDFSYGLTSVKRKSNGPETGDWLKYRELHEKPSNALELGLSYQHSINDNVYVELGLSYGRTTDIYNDTTTLEYLTTLENQVTEVHNYPDGSQTLISSNIEVYANEKSMAKYYQKHHQFALQALMGYRWSSTSGWGLSVAGGIEYSLSNNRVGKVQGMDRETINLSDLPYRGQGLFSSIWKANILKRISNKYHFTIGISGRQNITNAALASTYSERRSNYFASVGFYREL